MKNKKTILDKINEEETKAQIKEFKSYIKNKNKNKGEKPNGTKTR